MPDLERSSNTLPRLWPSVVIAAILAIAIPVIHFLVSDPFGFTVIFLPIYIPLAFAFIWPILVAAQGPFPRPWLERHTVALVLFLASVGCSGLWIEVLRRHSRNEAREELQKQQELRAAQDVISAKGFLAFNEPLNPGEADALVQYLHRHLYMPASDFLRMSEKYQDANVMYELARIPRCPPQAIKIIFYKTTQNAEKPMSGVTHVAVDYTFLAIAQRQDTPAEVLGKLLNFAPSPEARLAALKNPHLDPSGKIAYEKTLCPQPQNGSYFGVEFELAASDPDAPLPVLQCFAAQPGNRLYVAKNPRAPIELLEQLTRPEVDEMTRKAAQENIRLRAAISP